MKLLGIEIKSNIFLFFSIVVKTLLNFVIKREIKFRLWHDANGEEIEWRTTHIMRKSEKIYYALGIDNF